MRRGSRLAPPTVPSGRIVVQAPPELVPSEGGSGLLTSLLPMLGSVGAIVMVTISNAGPTGFITGGMFLLSSLGFVAVNGWRQRSQRTAQVLASRREYLAYLAELRETVRTAAKKQRRHGAWVTPAPAALPFIAEERTRVWERQPGDENFLLTRIGRSDQPLCITLEAPELPPLAQLDPVAASAAHRFMLTHETQPDLPLGVRLTDYARVELVGPDEEAVRGLARAMVAGVATLHDPEDVVVAVLAGDAQLAAWDWVKWLPHALSGREEDRLGPARMIGSSLDDLEDLLPAGLRERPRFARGGGVTPHVILVVDGVRLPMGDPVVGGDGMLGVTVLELPSRWSELENPDVLRIALPAADAAERRAELIDLQDGSTLFTPDTATPAEAEATARRLMPLHAGPSAAAETTSASTGQRELVELLGLPDVREIDFDQAWSGRLERDRLRVPIGQDTEGAPLVLDLKESAQQGMGPHGVMIGATGSGKSEVLRTLVLALALTHSPEQLNFVLVDFKGGATFAGMAGMPHVSAVITNLGSELSLVDRFQDALQGEVVRRQELLRAAGNFANVSDYEKARRGGRTDLAPLPALLIVADEFSELLAAKPEFVESFINIGRVGRSLQVHLLLASQRLEEGKLRGLDTYLSYRIGLRTFSAAESRTIIGTPDAYTLPQEPGVGFLKADTENLVQFRAAYVSGTPKTRMRGARAGGDADRADAAAEIEIFTAAPQPLERVEETSAPVAEEPGAQKESRSTFQIAVERMAGRGPAAHQVWLPPLADPASLDELMPDLVADSQLGLVSPSWRAAGTLTVPLGVVDVPLEQRREQLVVSLGGAAGHVAIVGSPLSGKSTMARTLVSALALTTTPLETQFYVLDFGGGSFTGLQRHPHLAGIATRTEAEAVRRTVAEVESILDARELYFRQQGIDSIDTYRQRRARGLVDDGYGDVFLVVDGWATLRSEYEALENRVQTIAARGLSFGVHVVVTANRWLEIRASLKDLIQTRLELRLGDPSDSEIDRKQAANVPANQPGRGLSAAKLQMLAAIPRIDGSEDASTLVDGVDDMIARVTAAWQGPAGPKLRLLPELVSLADVRAQAGDADRRLLLGIDEAALAPFGVDPRSEPHLYLYGDAGMGKSSFLRGIAQEITRLYGPNEAKIFVVDYRRALLGEIPREYLGAYLTSHEMASGGMNELSTFFSGRIPGPDVTPEQLRDRSWWSGAEGFVLVDDYDLVATSQGNPLAVLQPLLAQASDVGLHVILTRRTGGASRAAYDPIIQRFTDLGVTGILLGGSPDEGALIGRVKPVPSVPGRAQIVSREKGLVTAQLAFSPPLN
ncbi:type VII secretion protein EccCa [Microbacterium sp. SORGH_AS_0888]|uniref:type VII secretion protein EccCa n=1 Tax=Microbacterium sp. SORGH_AS_0888 TaxID=3041791 RepID=UPI0027866100|nr:type VII secretion protein EccCa [Microbacterium sp. SORGH_AS_0888]MDQ1129590.1 S-DNA-T family DNA segregation ATPase FtsK/SpoIIIE [Microbacterium sp. SORGH_AS_0888]